MAMTPTQEAQYALDFGLARSDLKPEAQAEYDRLALKRQRAQQDQRERQHAEVGKLKLALARLEQSGKQDARTLELRRKLERAIAEMTSSPVTPPLIEWFPALGLAVREGGVYRHGADRNGRSSSRQVYLDRRGAEMPLLGSLAGARAEVVAGKAGSRRSGGTRVADAAAGVILTGGALGLLAGVSRAGTGVAMVIFADGLSGPQKLLTDRRELTRAQAEAARFNVLAGLREVPASADSDLDRLKQEMSLAQDGVAAELERLAALHSSGMLDDEEFRAAKARIIGG